MAQPPDRRAFFVNPAKQLDGEAMKKSAAAAQQLGSVIGDPTSIGAKLMSKMGFGVAGQGLGRAGQVRCASQGHLVNAQKTAYSARLPQASLWTLSQAALSMPGQVWHSKAVALTRLSGKGRLRAWRQHADFVSRHLIGSS